MNSLDYDCTQTGSLNESAIDKEETDLSNHYLYGSGDDKSDYSYPLVGADGCLYRGNVASAWSLGCRGQCSDGQAHDEKLKELGKEFEDNPIPEDAYSDKQAFEKRVAIEKADSDRQVATGMCMVPWSVDKQGDWESPDTIRALSEGFMERLATGDAQNGVMHAVFDSDDLSHIENRVLDTSEKHNGTTYPAGSWEIGVKVHNDDLWQLIDGDDPALSGFSIGGYIHESKEYDADSLPPEVGTATKADGTVREITDATIKEVSIVDTPAVPQATIQVAKDADGFAKADDRLTAGVDTATNYLVEERGHSESDAREIATYLNGVGKSATASDGSGSWLSRAKSFFSRRSGGSNVENTTPDDHDMTDQTEKQGRVLSGENIERAMAVHDIAIDLLDGTDVRQNRLRFSDDISTDFDVAEFESKVAEPTDEPAESGTDGTTETMNQDDKEEIASLVVDKMSDGDNEAEAQAEEKNAENEGEETSKVDDLAETVKQLAETVEEQGENQQQILERIENAEGASQQKATTDDETSDDPLDKLAGGLA